MHDYDFRPWCWAPVISIARLTQAKAVNRQRIYFQA
jgi:hypothetical protein